MVLRVCRAVLRDSHDADDAFQATFLVLVRRAGSLWVRDSLGPWLHQVAHRAASARARPPSGAGDTSYGGLSSHLWQLTTVIMMTSTAWSMMNWPACRSVTARRSCSASWRA